MSLLLFLALGLFTIGSTSFLVPALLPQIGETLGTSLALIAQGVTSFSLAYLLSAPLFAIILANHSIKRRVQIALLIFIIGNLFSFLSTNITFFLVARAITGIGAGIFTPLCLTLAGMLSKPHTKGKFLSLLLGANSAGVVFGVPIGLSLSKMYSWQLPLALIAFFAAVSLLGFSFEKLDQNFHNEATSGNRFSLLQRFEVFSVLGVTCFISFSSLGLFSYIAPLQQGAYYSLELSLFVWGLGGFLGSSFIGFVIDQIKRPSLIMSFIVFGLMLSLLSLSFTKMMPYVELISFFFWGLFGWAITSPQQYILSNLDKKNETILAALNSSALGLGHALGSGLVGLVIASGFQIIKLPILASLILFGVFVFQFFLTQKKEF